MQIPKLIALTLLMLSFAAQGVRADDNSDRPGRFFDAAPASSSQQADSPWWNGLDESIRPSADKHTGRWQIAIKLFDESGREISESEMYTLSNYPAQLSCTQAPGQAGSGDYSALTDYQLLVWVIPDALQEDFLEFGQTDWPVPNSDVMVVNGEEHWIESSPPSLSDEQKRALFAEALQAAHEVVLEGLHLYIYSRNAERAEINLKWEKRVDGESIEGDATDQSPLRQVAELTMYFDK